MDLKKIAALIEKLAGCRFTGAVTLNFHKGDASQKIEIKKIVTEEDLEKIVI